MYLVYKHDNVKWRRNLVVGLLGFVIIMIGISRVYLGVHYASDVIGGFCMSVAYLMLFITFSPKILELLKKKGTNEKKETKKAKN